MSTCSSTGSRRCSPRPTRSPTQPDLILAGGLVVDGTGSPSFEADVAIAGDRIVAVGDLSGVDAARRLDVAGAAVAPGLIDVHVHSEVELRSAPVHEAGLP